MPWKIVSFSGDTGTTAELTTVGRRSIVRYDDGGIGTLVNYELLLQATKSRRAGRGGKWQYEVAIADLNNMVPTGSVEIGRTIGFTNLSEEISVSREFGPSEGFVDGDVVAVSVDFDAGQFSFLKNGVLVNSEAIVVGLHDEWVPILNVSVVLS